MATLYSPEGKKYETGDKAEVTRLTTAHGYTTQPPTAETVGYRDLQARAKERGIPANQPAEKIADAIADDDKPTKK